MAQYKVPQDVEADDKLIGPFSFRQFVYLLVAAGLVALCIPLFNIFPLLIILPAPFILFLLALSLPLKKDQPMETYLSAVLSYYMKPHNRLWEPGEPESIIVITAPKKTDEVHLKDIDQDEAMHRLSFLADIVDTEGYAIKGASNNGVREDVLAEANATKDIFEAQNTAFSQKTFQQTSDTRHNELVNQMRNAIANNNQFQGASIVTHNGQPQPQPQFQQPMPQQPQYPNYASAEPVVPVAPVTPLPQYQQPMQPQPIAQTPPPEFVTEAMQPQQSEPEQIEDSLPTSTNPLDDESVSDNSNIIKPDLPIPEEVVEQIAEEEAPKTEYIPADIAAHLHDDDSQSGRIEQQSNPTTPSQDIIDLANNSDFSIETIAKQAKRINEKQDNEVYISLH